MTCQTKQSKRSTHKRIKLKHRHHFIAYLISGPDLSNDPKDWWVTLGEHHLKSEDWFEQGRTVKSIYTHPQYSGGGNEVRDQEIKGIPPDYDVGMRNFLVNSSSIYLSFLILPTVIYLSSHRKSLVKMSMISLKSSLFLKLFLNSLVYHGNIFGSSSKVFGNLRKSFRVTFRHVL